MEPERSEARAPAHGRRNGKRLLVAAIGVATVSYVGSACGVQTSSTTSGNLVPPPPRDAADVGSPDASDRNFISPSGNLMATPTGLDAGQPVPPDASLEINLEPPPRTSGNLMPPPPPPGSARAPEGAPPPTKKK